MALAAPGTKRRPVPGATFAPARTTRRRLARRALLCADLLGLTLAYAAAAITDDGNTYALGASIVFVLTLPLWISGAKLLGLYDHDERPGQSTLDDLDVQIDLVPRLFEAVGPVAAMHAIEGMPLVTLPPAHPSRLARRAKRMFDVVVAAVVLVIALPLLALIA